MPTSSARRIAGAAPLSCYRLLVLSCDPGTRSADPRRLKRPKGRHATRLLLWMNKNSVKEIFYKSFSFFFLFPVGCVGWRGSRVALGSRWRYQRQMLGVSCGSLGCCQERGRPLGKLPWENRGAPAFPAPLRHCTKWTVLFCHLVPVIKEKGKGCHSRISSFACGGELTLLICWINSETSFL